MKKYCVLIAAGFLVATMSLAQDSTKLQQKKASVHSGKSCAKPVKIKKG